MKNEERNDENLGGVVTWPAVKKFSWVAAEARNVFSRFVSIG